jgi:hypothetical protein
MPDPAGKLRLWSALSESEQTELMLTYQPVPGREALACNFERKRESIPASLGTRGASIAEAEIRSPRRRQAER